VYDAGINSQFLQAFESRIESFFLFGVCLPATVSKNTPKKQNA